MSSAQPTRGKGITVCHAPLRCRFMPYNGMMSERQIKWLRELVIDSKKNQDRIIVLSHTPMIPSAIDVPTSVMWNYDAFLNALHCMDEKNGNPVAAMVLAGHHHRGVSSKVIGN